MVFLTRSMLSTFQIRDVFKIPDKMVLHWFPGHMGKGLKQMKQKLKSVDCIVEVHDARIPFSGRNPNFQKTLSDIKPHILVLNKKDLTDTKLIPSIKAKLNNQGIVNILFSNCKDQSDSGAKKIVPLAVDLISKSERFNRSESSKFCIMVIGVPNVGKSSVINFLRNKYLKKSNAAPVGAIAGITRSVPTEIKVSENPPIYVLDTPGILTPNVPNTETGMRLALCANLQDHLVGIELIANYLLYWMNKNNNLHYVEYLGLKEPSDNITEVLVLAAVKMNRVKKVNKIDGSYSIIPDTNFAAMEFVKAFRTGVFGKILLDRDHIQS